MRADRAAHLPHLRIYRQFAGFSRHRGAKHPHSQPAPGAKPAARGRELPHHLDDGRQHALQRPAQ